MQRTYPIEEIARSLKKLEKEAARLAKLTEGIPAAQTNITPILAFIDILNFHLPVSDGEE